MKTKKTLAFLLAFAMTVGATVFASCGDDVGDSLGNTSSSSSVSGNLPSSGSAEDSVSNDASDSGTNSSDISNTENNDESSSDDDSSQSGGMNEAAKATLIAATEKTAQSDNYTENQTMYIKIKSKDADSEEYQQFVEGCVEGFSKVDGDKSENQSTQKHKNVPDGAWITETYWYFKQIISKTEREDGSIEGESYYYSQDENGVWYKTKNNYIVSASETSTILMKIYENLAYDENTGLYTLTDYTYTFTLEEIFKSFFGVDDVDLDDVSIDCAEASFTVYEFQIELKDGYIHRCYCNIELKADISVAYMGSSFGARVAANYNVNITYSDYGTTVVTLPVVKEEIEDDIVD